MEQKSSRTQAQAIPAGPLVAAAAALMLAGCGAGGDVLGGYDLPQTADVPGDDWPRLVDGPPAPAPGVFGPATPDPAEGRSVAAALQVEAAASAARAAELGAPVLTEEEADRLRGAGRR